MVTDHVGVSILKNTEILRIIGRLAFPVFAFFIAEGFRYTRSRTKYFFRIFVLGALCQLVYVLFLHDNYIGVLLTFSLSIIVMSVIDALKKSMYGDNTVFSGFFKSDSKASRILEIITLSIALILVVEACGLLTKKVEVDYGFFGIMLPAFVFLFDNRWLKLAAFSTGLLLLSYSFKTSFPVQWWSLLTIPLMALYNGKPGKYKMKYFFYIFYPAHLVVIYLISLIVR